MQNILIFFLFSLISLFSEQFNLVAVNEIAKAAQEKLSPEAKEYLLRMDALEKEIKRQTGEILILEGKVKLEISEDYYFLDSEDAGKVLLEWGNPPSEMPMLGMIFPAKFSPFEAEPWGVTIEYSSDGYVNDEEAADLNHDDMLQLMRDATTEENTLRENYNLEPIVLAGWAAKPHYDSKEHKLHWAKELQFGEDQQNTLNYNIRVLGKEGFLVMNFIAGMDQYMEVQESVQPVLAMTNFTKGNAYKDFKEGEDKVAPYGIGQLVVGEGVAKTGFLNKVLTFLKKGWWVILLFFLGWLSRNLKGKSQDAKS